MPLSLSIAVPYLQGNAPNFALGYLEAGDMNLEQPEVS